MVLRVIDLPVGTVSRTVPECREKMQQMANMERVMMILAAATPLLAAILAYGWPPLEGEVARRPQVLRNLWILALAGPLNLLIWFLMNRWLDASRGQSAVTYALAAVIFAAAGFATGFFGRLWGRRRHEPAPPHDSSADE